MKKDLERTLFILIEFKEQDIKENIKINLNNNLQQLTRNFKRKNNNSKKSLYFPIELEIELESFCLKKNKNKSLGKSKCLDVLIVKRISQ